jgi:hypothetical protein
MSSTASPEPTDREQPERRTHVVRFEAGPRDGSVAAVLALETGQPPDLLLTPGRPDWVYVLAGGPRSDGSLPYLYMPPSKAARVRARGRRKPDRPDGA